jgi:hypothetical protein
MLRTLNVSMYTIIYSKCIVVHMNATYPECIYAGAVVPNLEGKVRVEQTVTCGQVTAIYYSILA